MNIQTGLTRISAAFWGFLGLCIGAWGLFVIFSPEFHEVWLGLIALSALIPLYIGHRVTCWIVAGFFAPR